LSEANNVFFDGDMVNLQLLTISESDGSTMP